MNSRHTALCCVSEWCKEKLKFPGELAISHVTLINISQLAGMVCYLNLMKFWTERNASKQQGVIKWNRRQYKSCEKPKGKKKQEGRGEKTTTNNKKRNTVCFVGRLNGMKITGRHLYLNTKLCSNLCMRGYPVLVPCMCISDLDHLRALVSLADRLICPLNAMYKLKKTCGSLM